MGTQNMTSWRRGRSLDMPARALSISSCRATVNALELVALPFAPANKQHDYLGTREPASP